MGKLNLEWIKEKKFYDKLCSKKKETVERKWYVIDAEGKPLGRVASKAAHILRGKHKATYTQDQILTVVILLSSLMLKKSNSNWK